MGNILPKYPSYLGWFDRYYHDGEDDECDLFVYGGCGGGPNNLVSKEECDVQPKVDELCSKFKKGQCPRRCEQIKATCLAYIPRYYYDKSADKCVSFVYGGCELISNYETREECEKNCRSPPKTHTETTSGSTAPDKKRYAFIV